MAPIAEQKYVRITTFTKDGRPKPAPVWIAPLGDTEVGFTTDPNSWKARRIRTTPNVELAPCDMRGRVEDGAPTVKGTASVVTGDDAVPVKDAIKRKYGLQFTLITAFGKLKRLLGKDADDGGAGIRITLD